MKNSEDLSNFTNILDDEIPDSQPLSLWSTNDSGKHKILDNDANIVDKTRPPKHTGQNGEFRSIDEIDPKYRCVFTYPFFNLVQSRVIEDALYSDKSIVVCAPTGSGKTVVFEMAIVQLLMELEDKGYTDDFKIVYMAPVKSLCTERLTEWYRKLTQLGLLCIEVTGDTDIDFSQLGPYKVIITTPEKWDMLTRRWTDYRALVEQIKLFLVDEVHILNDESRGPVLEAVVSRMKAIESSSKSAYRIEQLQNKLNGVDTTNQGPPNIRFVAVSATVSNPEDVAQWLGNDEKPAVYYKFGDECRPVKIKRIVEGYNCPDGMSIFKFDIILNYKLWPIIQKYYNGKPTLIFCNTRKSVQFTAETLAKELTINFNEEQRAKLTAIGSNIKNKKLQILLLNGVGCHHAGLLYEERFVIEQAFRQRDLPILITTTTLAMGVNLPAHLVIIKNTQQYVNGTYQEYSISTILQMVGRAGRPQFDNEATAVIMTRNQDKARYQNLVGGSEPLQSYLHKRLTENLNSEAALHTVTDVAQCVQWLRSTFLYVRAAKDPRRYLGLSNGAEQHLISKKIEELCVKAMNGLASAGLITMDEACCIESTDAGRLMSVYYLDFETMKRIMMIPGDSSLENLLTIMCESKELSDIPLRVDERRCLNTLNRNRNSASIRFPVKGKINTRAMKIYCIIQAILGCIPIPDPSLNQEAVKIMRVASRVSKCLVAYVTRPVLISEQPQCFVMVLNSILLDKCITAHLWENSPFVSKQLKGIGPTFSQLLVSAGKINFMLLKESHPRDLERIINKGPPAGNIMRKQISLLPNYQLNINPVNGNIVSIEVTLLNQAYLAENLESLTAGNKHKSYIIVGDSENNILLLKSFCDNDLINVYDGVLSYQITRRHRHEHKIVVHCLSSKIVGIDVQSDYTFQDLDINRQSRPIIPPSLAIKKQTAVSDTYNDRKRKNEDKIAKSKEKKKRDNTMINKIRTLKESFENVSNDLRNNLNNLSETSTNTLKKIPNINSNNIIKTSESNHNKVEHEYDEINNIRDDDDLMLIENEPVYKDDSNIDDILANIENEISHKKNARRDHFHIDNSSFASNDCSTTIKQIQEKTAANRYKILCTNKKTKTTNHNKPDNFYYIDNLEENIHLSDDESDIDVKCTSFNYNIKDKLDQYLQNVNNKITQKDATSDKLFESSIPSNDETYLQKSPENYIQISDDLPKVDFCNDYMEKSARSQIRKDNLINTEFLDPSTKDIEFSLISKKLGEQRLSNANSYVQNVANKEDEHNVECIINSDNNSDATYLIVSDEQDMDLINRNSMQPNCLNDNPNESDKIVHFSIGNIIKQHDFITQNRNKINLERLNQTCKSNNYNNLKLTNHINLHGNVNENKEISQNEYEQNQGQVIFYPKLNQTLEINGCLQPYGFINVIRANGNNINDNHSCEALPPKVKERERQRNNGIMTVNSLSFMENNSNYNFYSENHISHHSNDNSLKYRNNNNSNSSKHNLTTPNTNISNLKYLQKRSNQTASNTNRKTFKTNYSFTKTNTNVWTTESKTAKCTLKVVKKVKVDLDVTAIIEKNTSPMKEKQHSINVEDLDQYFSDEIHIDGNDDFSQIFHQPFNYYGNDIQSYKPELKYNTDFECRNIQLMGNIQNDNCNSDNQSSIQKQDDKTDHRISSSPIVLRNSDEISKTQNSAVSHKERVCKGIDQCYKVVKCQNDKSKDINSNKSLRIGSDKIYTIDRQKTNIHSPAQENTLIQNSSIIPTKSNENPKPYAKILKPTHEKVNKTIDQTSKYMIWDRDVTKETDSNKLLVKNCVEITGEKYVQSDKRESNNTVSKNKNEDATKHEVTLKDKIDSILNKYASALKIGPNNLIQQTIAKKEKPNTYQIGPKRPFKIKDIDVIPIDSTPIATPTRDKISSNFINLEQIKNSIQSQNPSINSQRFNKSESNKVNRHNTDNHESDTHNSQRLIMYDRYSQHHRDNPIENVNQINLSPGDLKLTQTLTNTLLELDQDQDFNIDNAVLDPKTLLQSINMNEDSEILIPPPPLFSNELDNTPSITESEEFEQLNTPPTIQAEEAFEHHHQQMDTENTVFETFISDKYDGLDANYQEMCSTVYSPQINNLMSNDDQETWTLPVEENAPDLTPRSFAFNTNIYDIQTERDSESRNQLKKFRFENKSRFKVPWKP